MTFTVTHRARGTRLKPITTATPAATREKAYSPDAHERVLIAADSLGLSLAALAWIADAARRRRI